MSSFQLFVKKMLYRLSSAIKAVLSVRLFQILVITPLQKLKTGWGGAGWKPSLSTFDTSQQGEKSFPGKAGWILAFFCCHKMQIFADWNPSAVSLGRWPSGYSSVHTLLCIDVITLSEIKNILAILWVNPLKKFYFVTVIKFSISFS